MARTPDLDIRKDYQRNYIINGNFDFWQRGTLFPAVLSSALYTADRFIAAGTEAGVGITRSNDSPGVSTFNGFSMEIYRTTGMPSGSSDFGILQYRMEGVDFADLYNKKAILSFWVKASTTGTSSVGFRNRDLTQSYVMEYEVTEVDTWQKIELPMDFITSSTGFGFSTDVAWNLNFNANLGSDFTTSDTNQWVSGDFAGGSNQTNFLAANNSYVRFAQVQLTVGSEPLPFRRAGRNYGGEFALCQRYFQKSWDIDTPVGTTTTSGRRTQGAFCNTASVINEESFDLANPMRIIPAVTLYSSGGTNINQISWVTRGSSSSVHTTFAITRATQTHFNVEVSGVSGGARGDSAALIFHFTADAEL